MEAEEAASPPGSVPRRPTDLFGAQDEELDVFAQLGGHQDEIPPHDRGTNSNDYPSEDASPDKEIVDRRRETTGEDPLPNLESLHDTAAKELFEEGHDEEDVFARLGDRAPERKEITSVISEMSPSQSGSFDPTNASAPMTSETPSASEAAIFPDEGEDILSKLAEVIPETKAKQTNHNKDFSDLLAEFEGDEAPSPLEESDAVLEPIAPPPAPPISSLFENDRTAFDDLVDSPPSPSPVPSLTIEKNPADMSIQSIFSSASDWLADTSMEESFVEDADDREAGDGSALIDFQVPEGWYDDNGEWQWYTEEDKEQVRLAMLVEAEPPGRSPRDSPGCILSGVTLAGPSPLSTLPYSPGMTPFTSENAARRTPLPEQSSFPPQILDAYLPSRSLQAPVSAGSVSYSPNISYESSHPSPYAPAVQKSTSSASSYAPQTSLIHDPYAPTKPALASYASQPFLSHAGPSKPSISTEPPKLKRVVSTAYDPPFLKPQKSFARPASAVPTVPGFQTPEQIAPPVAATAPSALLPPPPGPPRRTKTTGPTYSNAPPTGSKGRNAMAPPPILESYPGSDSTPDFQAEPYTTRATNQDPYAAYTAPPPVLESSRPPNFSPLVRGSSPHGPPRPPSVHGPPRPSSALRNEYLSSPSAETSTTPTVAFSPPLLRQSAFAALPPGPSRKTPSPMNQTRPLSRGSVFQGTPSPEVTRGVMAVKGLDEEVAAEDTRQEQPPEGFGGWQDTPEESYQPSRPPAIEKRPSMLGLQQMSPPRRPYHQATQESEPPYTTYTPHPSYSENSTQTRALDLTSTHPTTDPYGMTSSYAPYDPSPREAQSAGRAQTNYSPYGASPQSQKTPVTQLPYAPSNPYEAKPFDPFSSSPQSTRQNALPVQPNLSDPYARTASPAFIRPVEPYASARGASPAYTSDYGISPPAPNYFQAMHISAPADDYIPAQLAEQRPVSEDPLGRCTMEGRNIPLAIFGFGGVIITAFPGNAEEDQKTHSRTPSYGYASGRGQIWLRNVSNIISPSGSNDNDSIFPGPLVSDPAVAKGVAGEKKKKEEVLKYLQARAEEIERGLPYLKSSASGTRREEDGKLVLVRLLAAMVIGDGKLFGGSDQAVDDAIRLALQNPSSATHAQPPHLSSNAISPISNGFSGSLYPSTNTKAAAASVPQLQKLSVMLQDGDKREAALYSAEHGLWSHALVISSCVDQELWKEIVSRFAKAELNEAQGVAALQASYSLFSGQTASSVDNLILAASIKGDPSDDQWREVLGAIIFNGKPTDLICLDEFGNKLSSSGLVNAAQACFLLSPSSPFFDPSPAAYDRRVRLIENSRDEDAIIFAEIAEYVRSLIPLPKGSESFSTLPQLLAYKLHRAWQAAEIGDEDRAKRYCTAIEAASPTGKNAPSILPRVLRASLEDLIERLTGSPSVHPARVIGGRKTVKPGLDKLGSWIEGRLTKFIAGEEEQGIATKASAPPVTGAGSIGPFSHFSTISQPASSGQISRSESAVDLQSLNTSNGRLAPSPNIHQGSWGSSTSASGFGAQQNHLEDAGGSSYTPWAGENEDDGNTPLANPADTEGGYLNPMASAFSLNQQPPQHPQSTASQPPTFEDDDEDLGFGNTSVSRAKTPRVPENESANGQKDEKRGPKSDVPKGLEQKPSGWLGRWWGKKEGEGGGPIRAKLGEESSMVFDPELKRWIVKGATPEAAPAPTPPPPRAQTASPSRSARPDPEPSRAMSATPPPSQAARPASNHLPPRSSLAESVTAEQVSGPPPPSGPPLKGPPSTTSIDDLLSRPPSKRPASAAKKSMRSRYVDVLQPPGQ
ncbi:COPII coat assembly protein SEC16, partial [Tremellales sp. Uapishka_1]